jgi:hypothetical protein
MLRWGAACWGAACGTPCDRRDEMRWVAAGWGAACGATTRRERAPAMTLREPSWVTSSMPSSVLQALPQNWSSATGVVPPGRRRLMSRDNDAVRDIAG